MLNDTEIEILRIVANSDKGHGWYGIAIRLSNTDAPQKSEMMGLLRELTNKGFLSFDTEKNGWQITEAGLTEISQSGT